MTAIDFTMPSLGADMQEGTVLEWKLAPGTAFSKGDVVLEVDTDKAAFEVEADYDGVLEQILVEPGTTVPVGTVLARVQGAGAAAAPATETVPSTEAAFRPPAREHAQREPGVGESGAAEHRRRVSPRARKRARELNVDLASIDHGSGVDGAIDVADVEAAAAGAVAPSREGSRPERLRAVIAAAMSRSKREIPHYYLAHTIDLEPALRWLDGENASRPITERILANVLLLKAVAVALDTVPELNGYWEHGAFRPRSEVHLGVAISLRGGGVIAPALHDAGNKPLPGLMSELADLVRRARAGTVRHREMTEGTITVTSLGDRGADVVQGVIFPPQVALVGFGTVAARPWVVDGQVVARRVVTATLSADHRASDGHRGALFLRALADRLQEPQTL